MLEQLTLFINLNAVIQLFVFGIGLPLCFMFAIFAFIAGGVQGRGVGMYFFGVLLRGAIVLTALIGVVSILEGHAVIEEYRNATNGISGMIQFSTLTEIGIAILLIELALVFWPARKARAV